MKKVSIIFTVLFVLFSSLSIKTVASTSFKDIPSNYWAKTEIEHLTGMGIIKGYSDGKFKPGAHITRQQAAIMLSRALNLSLTNRPNPGYKDVHTQKAGFKEIAAVVDEGIFTNKTYFYPDRKLTRGEMAKALVNGYHLTGSSSSNFSDVSSKHPYAKEINIISEQGISKGFKDGTFRPNNPVTRAEFSAFIYRIIQNKDGQVGSDIPVPNPTKDFSIYDFSNNFVTSFKSRDEAINYAMNYPGTKVIPPNSKGFASVSDTHINNGVLIYNGLETDAKLAKEGKFPANFFDSYVAYQKDGQFIDRFYDTFIILGLRYPNGHFQQSFQLNKSDYSDWDWYLNRTFDPEGAINRLNESAQATNVGKVKVYMAIPYPKNHYTFTTPDGNVYDANNTSRFDIVKWYLEEVERRIHSGNYSNIQLEGFYWLNETVNLTEDEALLKELSQYIKYKGHKFIFSPHAGAANLQNWNAYGFNAAFLQSNAFKIRNDHESMVKKLHEGYIRALQFGTAVNLEIENSGPKDVEVSFRNLRTYLELGQLYDLKGKSTIMYQGTEMIYRLTKSDDPEYTEMYDTLYKFFKANR